MRDCIKGLERRVEELGGDGKGELEGVDLKEEMSGGRGIVENRLREGKERRRNVLKGVEVKDGKRKKQWKRC